MQEIEQLISELTLEEKASLCSGLNYWYTKSVERLDIPSIMLTDGPHGLRKQVTDANEVGLEESVPATCFPTASALAATWNRELLERVGVALGEECRQEGVSVILGPGANIKRSPLCGRNFEYFSEDPYLSGEMAKSHIRGVQRQGVGTSLKHYVANNQEFRRMTIDTIVDERALREIYLAGFEIAVREAQPWTVMCSYNKINGTYASDHKRLMREILKDEWGHEGLVVTDWGAMNDRVKALAAGVELEMPKTNNGNDALIVEAVQAGELDESVLDAAVARVLKMVAKAEPLLENNYRYDPEAHHALAREVAGEGAVLLKNENRLLPLIDSARVALIGRFAKHPRYQGAGSSQMNPTQLDTIYEEMSKLVGEENLVYAEGYTEKAAEPDEGLIAEALEAAAGADVVVICAGLPAKYEAEGLDRAHMRMPEGHNVLIERIAEEHDKVVVVLSNGAPVEMPWVDDVEAILEGYLGGQAGAGAIADILYGRVNPSGKLAETFPLRLADTPAVLYFPGGPTVVEYRESLYVGYRYYDAVDQPVLFPFGFGLSYTSFAYRDLQLVQDTGEDPVTVRLTVENTGEVSGQEIVQVYVRDVESTPFRPRKELKGFTKVALEPGEAQEVEITLPRRAFAFYDAGQGDWIVEPGEFEILVGASSQDIRLSGTIRMESDQTGTPPEDKQMLSPYYNPRRGLHISQAEFEALLGRTVPPNQGPVKGLYSLNTPVEDMSDSFIGRQLHRMMIGQIRRIIRGQEDTPTALLMLAVVKEMPLRNMLMSGDDTFNREKLEALLQMVNGQFFKGLFAFIKAWLF
ncbi:glycoside hydrolase family 3 C-terminal domain-containing protein [bacterium]|nr:glycoside hydrolase family 3 C-terminal domain-containing protein [bacterium]